MKKKILLLVFAMMMGLAVTDVKAMTSEEIINTIKNNGTLKVDAIKPEGSANEYIVNYILRQTQDMDYYFALQCGESNEECEVELVDISNGWQNPTSTMHTIRLEYAEKNENTAKEVSSFINKINRSDEEIEYFDMNDFDLINYFLTAKNRSLNNLLNYSSDFKNTIGSSNIDLYLDSRMGAGVDEALDSTAYGYLGIYFNGILYDTIEAGVKQNHIIYISEETEETTDAYIKAAEERVNNFFGADTVDITYAGVLSTDSLGDSWVCADDTCADMVWYYEKYDMLDAYYKVKVGEEIFNFIIVKDSEKASKKYSYKTVDYSTNINITTDKSIPNDTKISVKNLADSSDEYKTLESKLNAEEIYNMVDLKLYSEASEQYISKLENGQFLVNMPISDDLTNKDLFVYYVNEDGTVDTYEVTVENGYATFETNHFSTYILASSLREAETEPNPNTLDNIGAYFAIGIVSLIGLGISMLYINKKSFN